jgi:hypothetical protein
VMETTKDLRVIAQDRSGCRPIAAPHPDGVEGCNADVEWRMTRRDKRRAFRPSARRC